MTIKEMTAKGGRSTLKRYGKDHFSKLGKKGWESRRKKDPDYGKKLSIKGVEARRNKQNSASKSAVDVIADAIGGVS